MAYLDPLDGGYLYNDLAVLSAGVPDPFQPPDGTWNLTGNLTVSTDVTSGGQFLSADGTVAAPGIGFTDDSNTGLYRTGSGDISFALDGAQGVGITNAGPDLGTTHLICSQLRPGTAGGANSALTTTVLAGTAHASRGIAFSPFGGIIPTSGDWEFFACDFTFAPSSGTANLRALWQEVTINQTGGANGDYTIFGCDVTETAAGGSDNALLRLSVGGTEMFKIGADGVMHYDNTAANDGATATCTLGQTGNNGPTTAAQNLWLKLNASGTTYWIPMWV